MANVESLDVDTPPKGVKRQNWVEEQEDDARLIKRFKSTMSEGEH